jgi:hypothetical protein
VLAFGLKEAAMTPAVLGSVIGAAALTLGRGAAAAAGNGLSFAGELLQSASATAVKGEDESTAGRERSILEHRIAVLKERIRRKLADAGITLDKPLELTSDGAGGIAVGADLPQRDVIEEILRNDFLLERDFHQLAGDYDELIQQHGFENFAATLTIAVPASPQLPSQNSYSAF